VLCCK